MVTDTDTVILLPRIISDALGFVKIPPCIFIP